MHWIAPAPATHVIVMFGEVCTAVVVVAGTVVAGTVVVGSELVVVVVLGSV